MSVPTNIVTGLTALQEKFCEEYIVNGYNATRAYMAASPKATEATAHMFIINPLSGVDFSTLFSTHPKTADRVARLREQAALMRR